MRALPLAIVGAAFLVTVTAVHAAAQAAAPWTGTSKLDTAKSKYSPGP